MEETKLPCAQTRRFSRSSSSTTGLSRCGVSLPFISKPCSARQPLHLWHLLNDFRDPRCYSTQRLLLYSGYLTIMTEPGPSGVSGTSHTGNPIQASHNPSSCPLTGTRSLYFLERSATRGAPGWVANQLERPDHRCSSAHQEYG